MEVILVGKVPIGVILPRRAVAPRRRVGIQARAVALSLARKEVGQRLRAPRDNAYSATCLNILGQSLKPRTLISWGVVRGGCGFIKVRIVL